MKERGVPLAVPTAKGDPGYMPAERAYERAYEKVGCIGLSLLSSLAWPTQQAGEWDGDWDGDWCRGAHGKGAARLLLQTAARRCVAPAGRTRQLPAEARQSVKRSLLRCSGCRRARAHVQL